MCLAVLRTANYGTSSLLRHARCKHSTELRILTDKKAIGSPNHNIEKYLPNSEEKKNLDILLVKMISTDIQPISIVEDAGFINFCEALDPRFTLPSRRLVSGSLIPSLFNDMQERLRSKLEQAIWVCVTTDMWTSINTAAFLAVTVHFWNEKERKLCCFTLDCLRFQGRHTSQLLSEELQRILLHNNIMSKTVVCVTDNAANIVKAVKDINLTHVPCYAHTLNLVANGSLQKVPEALRIIETASKIVEQTKKSTLIHEKFVKIQQSQGVSVVKKLVQNCVTRWNSTYQMLERIVELKGPICELLSEQGMAEKVGCVDSNWWQAVSQFVLVLQPLYEATLDLSGENQPTGSKAIPITKMLTLHYQCFVNNSEPGTVEHNLAVAILANLNRRFGYCEDLPELALASILDPRFKGHGFQLSSKLEEATEFLIRELEKTSEIGVTLDQVPEIPSKRPRGSLWEPFDQHVAQQGGTGSIRRARTELNAYLQLPCETRGANAIAWWNENGRGQFPLLFNAAMKYLIIPASSIPSERVFSTAGQVLTKRRNRLSDESARMLICMHNNMNA